MAEDQTDATKDPKDTPSPGEKADLKVSFTRSKQGAKPLQIDPGSIPEVPKEKANLYWCGVTPDCPRVTVTCGGFDFPLYRQKQEPDPNDETRAVLAPTKYAGRVHEMTDGQLEWCLQGIANRVFRANAGRDLKAIHGGRKPFVPMPGDAPLGMFVYIMKVDSKHSFNREMDGLMGRIKPLIERPKGFGEGED